MAATLDDIKDQLKEQNQKQDEANSTNEEIAGSLRGAKLTEAFRGGLQKFLGLDFVENFKKLGNRIEGMAKGLGDKLNSMVVSPAKDLLSGFFDAIKLGIGMIGGVLGLQSFIEGWNNAEKFFGANPDWGNKISAALATVIQTFTGISDEKAGQIAQSFDKIITAVSTQIMVVVDGIVSGFTSIVEGIKGGDFTKVILGIGDIWLGLSGALLNISESVIAWFVGEEKAGKFIQPLRDISQSLVNLALDVTNFIGGIFGVLTGKEGSWGKIASGLTGIATEIVSIFDNLATSVLSLFGWDDEYASIKETLGKVIRWVYDPATGKIFNIDWGALFTSVSTTYLNMKESITSGIKAVGNFIYNPETGAVFGIDFVALKDSFVASMATVYSNITTKLTTLGNFIYNSETGAVFGIDFVALKDNLILKFVSLGASITEKMTSISKFFYDPETGAVFGVNFGTLISDITTKITEKVTAIPEMIGNYFVGLMDKITGVFENLINGVIEKINKIPGVNIEPVKMNRYSTSPDQNAEAALMAKQVGISNAQAANENAVFMRSLSKTALAPNAADMGRLTGSADRNAFIGKYGTTNASQIASMIAGNNQMTQAEKKKEMEQLGEYLAKGMMLQQNNVVNNNSNTTLTTPLGTLTP